MKLGDIVKARDLGAIDLVKNGIPIADGKKRYTARKLVEALEAELRTADAERTRIMAELAPGVQVIDREHPHPAFGKIVNAYDDFLSADTKVVVEPIYKPESLDGIAMTPAQEGALYSLGLVEEPKEEKPVKGKGKK